MYYLMNSKQTIDSIKVHKLYRNKLFKDDIVIVDSIFDNKINYYYKYINGEKIEYSGEDLAFNIMNDFWKTFLCIFEEVKLSKVLKNK